MEKNIINTGIKALKIVGSIIISAAIVEAGYMGGKMLGDDVECTVEAIDAKINPTIMKKRHWYSKPEKFNTRTKKFVADTKKAKKN